MSETTLKHKLLDYERNLHAVCFHCGKEFIKTKPCEKCDFYRCPHCGKCACDLPGCCQKTARAVVETMILSGVLRRGH